MQFLTSLFGGSDNSILTAGFALAAVLVLIVIGLWLMKLIFRATGTVGRARNRRLSVVDSMALDPKRQLLIIRRDNVEHLILTGGPQDVVVETGIPVEPAAPRNQTSRRPAAEAAPAPNRVPAPQHASVQTNAPQAVAAQDRPAQRLRDMEPGQRRAPALRHTGLMRPGNRMEPTLIPANADNSDMAPTDSAKTSAGNQAKEQAISEQTGSGSRDEA